MVTINNYAEKTANINFAKQPDYIQDAHKDFADYVEFYNDDDEIKGMLDEHLRLVNNIIKKEYSKPASDKKETKTGQKKTKSVKKPTENVKKVAQNANKSTNKAKKPVTKKATPAQKDEKCNKVEPVKTEHFTEDVRLLRRFAGCVGKERQRRTILTIYRDFERRITERKASRTSKHADLVAQCSRKLAKLLDAMTKQHLTHVTMEVDKQFQDKISLATKEVAIRTSVNLLKRFVGIEGEIKPEKSKVERIFKAFKTAYEQKKITENDFYQHELNVAYGAMRKFIEGKVNHITIEPTQLSGLDNSFGLGKTKATARKENKSNGSGKATRKKTKPQPKQLNGIEPEPTPAPAPQSEPVVVNRFQVDLTEHQEPTVFEPEEVNQDNAQDDRSLNGLFTPMADVGKDNHFEKINLPGDLGRFLGYVERYEYSIVLRGEKGAGKTRLTYQMMNTFAKAGFTVGSFTLEIGKDSNLVTDMRNEYLCPTIVDKVQIAESCPGGIDDVKAAAKVFDVVFIDSWGKIPNVDQDDFDRLRKEHPDTMFVVIFQSTTNGTVRGGSKAEYDGGMVIQVQKGGRAICEKNRYNGEDLTYLVFQRKLEEPEPTE
ncbi:hypothetical protein KDU71_02620 [Carboxylicivirga sediminis]|uniref:Uncharacterized protein n=1 Tax=Carboxylicivirga sediminis TaxID=2006564 RepID=A0A941F1V9_9BACT|nr:hypothetical protein [Carboxylicivirga sediminis]MBR8534439.1 hypothetical protein [Carboxylicivirga sediminis]